MPETTLKSDLQVEEIAAFLKQNPDIFQRHPQLLEIVTLADSGSTGSLLERQFSLIKERLQDFRSRQHELMEVARENEQISDSFSQIVYQLIGFNNLSEFASEFPKALRKTFDIDEVSIKTTQAVKRRQSEREGYMDALRRLGNNQAVCDNRWPSKVLSAFFSDAVKSAALLPLRYADSGEILGVLALGAVDSQRYTNELGTAHLNRLGMMTGICLARLQPAS